MARLSFQPGTRFMLKGEWFIVRERLLDRQFLLECQSQSGKVIKGLDEFG